MKAFRCEGLGILGILGFYTISDPKINLTHTFNANFCPTAIYRSLILKISKCLNRKIENRPIIKDRKIEIGIIDDQIRIEAIQQEKL